MNEQFYRKERNRLPTSVFKPTSTQTYLLNSVFKTQPPTIFFAYPEYITRQRKQDRLVKYKKSQLDHLFLTFTITCETHIYNAVVNSCTHNGLTLLETDNNVNLIWTGYI